jgi:hypothetical protein
LALVPSGSGAITAQVPDGTIAGGGARGDYAIDFQRARTTTNQGALGFRSGVFAGFNHNVTSLAGVIAGGRNNIVTSEHGGVFTGQSNTAGSNSHATVVGGKINTSSGQYSVSGGNGNTASGQGSVALGISSVANGTNAVALGGGSGTLLASGEAAIALGQQARAEGSRSFAANYITKAQGSLSAAFGWYSTVTTDGIYGFAKGYSSKSYLRGQSSLGNSFSANGSGNAQASQLVARKEDTLTTGGTTVLSLDGTGTTNLIIPDGNNRAWNVTVEYIGVCTAAGSGTTAVGDVVTGTDKFRFKRVSGTSTIGSVTNIELTQDATMTSAECTYAVGGSNDLQITFAAPTTANSTTFRVVAKVSLVEVAW